jgi:hypothetical protein
VGCLHPPLIRSSSCLTSAAAIWGFSGVGLAANAARDLGGRFAAMTIWGKDGAHSPHPSESDLTARLH